MLEIHAKMVYVDCDGVLADLDQVLEKYLGPDKDEQAKVLQLMYNNYTEIFLSSKRIAKGFDILNSLADYRVLTAMPNFKDFMHANITGLEEAYDRYNVLVSNKFKWLIQNGIKADKIIITPNRKFKCNYSSPDAVLIDDVPKNIQEWEQRGGIGILFHQGSEIYIKNKELE